MEITLVTGATGHLGGNVVRALREAGRPVRALVRTPVPWLSELDVEIARGDVRDAESVRRAVRGASVVYHLAGLVSLVRADASKLQECNVGGVRNVADACLGEGVRRLVHFSSVHALSAEPADRLIDETRELASAGERVPHYDRSKAAGEREIAAAAARGLDVVTLNPTGVIGPFDHKPSEAGRLLLDLHRGKVPSLVEGGYNFVDVRDVAKGAVAAETRGRKGERYVLAGQWLSVAQVASLVQEVTGATVPGFVCPMWLARTVAPLAEAYASATKTPPVFTSYALYALRSHRYISHRKATAELGHAPRPMRETIADTFAWFRKTGVI